MQFFLNLAFRFISAFIAFLDFSPPQWFADLLVGVIKYGTYAQYFVPVVTFFQVAFFCLTIHLTLMIASAVLQLL